MGPYCLGPHLRGRPYDHHNALLAQSFSSVRPWSLEASTPTVPCQWSPDYGKGVVALPGNGAVPAPPAGGYEEVPGVCSSKE